MNKLPTLIKEESLTDNHINLTLYMPKDLFWFQGHFPDYPILPGVAQIHWVMYYSHIYFPNNLSFIGMERIKFQGIILPNTHVRLELIWNTETNKLEFSFHETNLLKSQGKIKFQ